jgi:pimeloyl-ACP methyl ester carboxylesterase
MAALIGDTENLYVAGHSMGGLVGLLLASGWFGIRPRAVVAVGVKVDWTAEERAGIMKMADAPVRWFESEDEARERFVLVNGLKGMVEPSSDLAGSGIAAADGKWRLAADNRTAMVANADTRDIYRAANCPVTLAAGEHDAMVPIAQRRSLDAGAVMLPKLGHNAHVEDPEAVWRLIEQAVAKTAVPNA